jgi:hypothetical protein
MELRQNDYLQRKTKEQGKQHVQRGLSCKLNQSLSALLELTTLFFVVSELIHLMQICNTYILNKINIFK